MKRAECGTDLPTALIGQDIPDHTLPRAGFQQDEATALLPNAAAAVGTAQKPAAQPSSHNTKVTPRKKRSGAAVIVIVLLLVLAAGAAVYFMLFHDAVRMEELIRQAQAYEAQGDFGSAAEAYSECVLLGSKDAEVYIALAEAYDECGETEKALQVLKDGYSVTGDERVWAAFAEYEDKLIDE